MSLYFLILPNVYRHNLFSKNTVATDLQVENIVGGKYVLTKEKRYVVLTLLLSPSV